MVPASFVRGPAGCGRINVEVTGTVFLSAFGFLGSRLRPPRPLANIILPAKSRDRLGSSPVTGIGTVSSVSLPQHCYMLLKLTKSGAIKLHFERPLSSVRGSSHKMCATL